MNRVRDNSFKLKEVRFGLDIRKIFFTMRHQNRLSKETVDAPPTEGQVGWGFGQHGLIAGVPAYGEVGGWVDSNCSVILW